MKPRLSGILDSLRWISAILVVIAHTANLMVARLADTPHSLRSPALYLFVFSAGFGHQAVTVFYVLSGFLVGGPLVLSIQREGLIPWKKYVIDRVVRIYLVLIPALGVCYVFDHLTYRIQPAWVADFIQNHASLSIALGNLLNLQNFFVPFFGSNGPIGTLAIEMWFYISFPLLLAPLCFRYSLPKKIALLVAILVVNIILGHAQSAYLAGFVIWTVGVIGRLSNTPRFSSPVIPSILFLLIAIGIRAALRRDMAENLWLLFFTDLLLGGSLSLLLVTLRHLPEVPQSVFLSPIHKHMAGLSYSLYATHMPLLFLLTALAKSQTGFGIQDVVLRPACWLLVLAVMALCLLFAYLFSLLTERHTSVLRKGALRAAGV